MIQMITKIISGLVFLVVFISCSIFQKNIDYSKFMKIGEFKDSIFKAVAYKDTINFSRNSDTLAFIFKFEIINKNYTALYNWDRPEFGIYNEIDSLYFSGYITLFKSNLNYIVGFKEMANTEVLLYYLFLTKKKLLLLSRI